MSAVQRSYARCWRWWTILPYVPIGWGELALHLHHNLFAQAYRLSAENPDLDATGLTLGHLCQLLALLNRLATVT
jgi:hypothetical protein